MRVVELIIIGNNRAGQKNKMEVYLPRFKGKLLRWKLFKVGVVKKIFKTCGYS